MGSAAGMAGTAGGEGAFGIEGDAFEAPHDFDPGESETPVRESRDEPRDSWRPARSVAVESPRPSLVAADASPSAVPAVAPAVRIPEPRAFDFDRPSEPAPVATASEPREWTPTPPTDAVAPRSEP